MLTVDYDRLGLRAGELVLDLGCGFGRHGYEALRRGASVVSFDYAFDELRQVRNTFAVMVEQGEAPVGTHTAEVRGDAVRLPFPDDTFDRIIASEVLEHVLDDEGALDELARVLKPGGVLAATIPSWLPEKVCWALNDEYHAPFVEGGHVRIYTENEVREKMRASGLRTEGSHHAHALHSPYWWIKCAVGPTNDEHPLVQAYHRLLVWDISKNPTVLRVADKLLNPVLGKSLVVYAGKPPHLATGGDPVRRRAVRGAGAGPDASGDDHPTESDAPEEATVDAA